MDATPATHELITELTALNETINSGDSGLPAVERVVALAQRLTGAIGASFVEYGSAGGRVVATAGQCDFARGRWADPGEPVTAGILGQGRLIEVPVDALPPTLAGQLHAHGASRMLAARAELAGHVVGTLHAYFPERSGAATDFQRTVIIFLASMLEHLYGDNRGLPVFADSSPVEALADAAAVIATDGTGLSVNPTAAGA